MNIHYPHFMGGSQKCTQGTPLVKARNGKKLKMLNLKFAWILDPAANTRQTAVCNKLIIWTAINLFEPVVHKGSKV